jgi:hypothetical protein
LGDLTNAGRELRRGQVPQGAVRQTERAATFLLHVVCEWIGHSRLIAQEHYPRVTDADFERASGALQKPLQQPAEMGHNRPQVDAGSHEKTPVLQGFASDGFFCGSSDYS